MPLLLPPPVRPINGQEIALPVKVKIDKRDKEKMSSKEMERWVHNTASAVKEQLDDLNEMLSNVYCPNGSFQSFIDARNAIRRCFAHLHAAKFLVTDQA